MKTITQNKGITLLVGWFSGMAFIIILSMATAFWLRYKIGLSNYQKEHKYDYVKK